MVELAITVGLVVGASAMCSLFEAVLYAVPASHVEALAAAGRPSGRILQGLRANVDRPIAAILSLNTIANTAGAAVAGAIAARVFGTQWLIYFSAAFTLIILVLSEVIPKTAGVTFSRPLAVVIARPLQLLVVVFRPLIWLMQLVTSVITREGTKATVSGEELAVMARLGLRSGGIDANEAKVIQGVLSLASRTVRDIMTPRSVVYSLAAHSTVQEAHGDGGVLNHSRVPVFDEQPDDIVGVVHRRDVFATLARGEGDTPLQALMHAVDFVPDDMPADRLLDTLLSTRRHLSVVLDEFGGLAGVVTLEDALEEILGREIVDEFDAVADMRELAHEKRRALTAERSLQRKEPEWPEEN